MSIDIEIRLSCVWVSVTVVFGEWCRESHHKSSILKHINRHYIHYITLHTALMKKHQWEWSFGVVFFFFKFDEWIYLQWANIVPWCRRSEILTLPDLVLLVLFFFLFFVVILVFLPLRRLIVRVLFIAAAMQWRVFIYFVDGFRCKESRKPFFFGSLCKMINHPISLFRVELTCVWRGCRRFFLLLHFAVHYFIITFPVTSVQYKLRRKRNNDNSINMNTNTHCTYNKIHIKDLLDKAILQIYACIRLRIKYDFTHITLSEALLTVHKRTSRWFVCPTAMN